jgi:hypothetical protein
MGSPSEVEHVAGLKRDDVLAVGTIRAGAASQFVSLVLFRPIGRTGRLEPMVLRRLRQAAAL